jgi:homoserine O-acetyltransferase
MTNNLNCLPDFLAKHISSETRFYTLPDVLELENGQELAGVVVAYRTWGKLSNSRNNAILICHALTGSADADAWWPGIIGKDGAFDPEYDFVICSNILGGCYGTTGPVSTRPGDDNRYRASFPRISVRDMVNVQKQLLDHLGVAKLALAIGPSLGGMQVLEWAATYPEYIDSIVPIGVGVNHSAWCIGMSTAQRAAIYADSNWQDGFYSDVSAPDKGLAAARMMAICGYRSWESFDERFARDRQPSSDEFKVGSYLKYQGEKINDRFDANCYVRLTEAMNGHDVARGRGSYAEVLGKITQRALVVSVSSDLLYPPQEQTFLAGHLPNAQHLTLESRHGHDGFLIETAELARLIRAFRSRKNPINATKSSYIQLDRASFG